MTFLKSYSFSAVGFNFLLTCITMLWSPIAHSAAFAMIDGLMGKKVRACRGTHALVLMEWCRVATAQSVINPGILGVNVLTESLFSAAAVAISYGALLGRASGTQLLWLTMIQVFFFHCLDRTTTDMKVADIGGSLGIHAFGAYFGLAASLAISAGKKYGKVELSLSPERRAVCSVHLKRECVFCVRVGVSSRASQVPVVVLERRFCNGWNPHPLDLLAQLCSRSGSKPGHP